MVPCQRYVVSGHYLCPDSCMHCRLAGYACALGGFMIVRRTSVFPSGRDVIFQKIRKLETLQYIAKPYATFEPEGNSLGIWETGSTSSYHFKLFGIIPFGTHTIHIICFDPEKISSHEGNEHVPVWKRRFLYGSGRMLSTGTGKENGSGFWKMNCRELFIV